MNFERQRALLTERPDLYAPKDNDRQMILASKQPKLLRDYYDKVSEYYTYFDSYKKIKLSNNDTGVYAKVLKIKQDMYISYKYFLKIRVLYSTLQTQDKEYRKCFENVMKMEELITASINLLENIWSAKGELYKDDLDINIEEINILRLKIDQYNQPISTDPYDPIYAEFKDATERLLISSRRELAILKIRKERNIKSQKEARIVPDMVHIRNDNMPTHFRVPKIARDVEEAGARISHHPLQVAQAGILMTNRISKASGASGAQIYRGIVPSATPLPPPSLPQQPQRITSAASAASKKQHKFPETIIAKPPTIIGQPYRQELNPKLVISDKIRREYKGLVYPSLLPPTNSLLTATPKVNKSPPVLNARSHSFKSNSPDNDKKPEFEIEGDAINPPEVYLIDNKNDGLCFLNAIFDYLLYSDKLSIMYERLLAIEELILGKYGMDTNILKIKKAALLLIGADIDDLFVKKLIPVSQSREAYYRKQNEEGQLIRLIGDGGLRFKDSNNKVEHLGHPEGKKTYEDQRKNFVISMKYVLALYILSYGKKKFIDMIVFTLTAETSHIEWTENLRKTFKGNYEGNLDGFEYEYVLEYLINKNFFVNQTLIVMFKKILFKKIKKPSGENIPRFWLEITTIFMDYEKAIVPSEDKYPDLRTLIDDKNNKKFERVLNKYRFKASGAAQSNKYIHTDYKYDNYISLLCDEDRLHYLLFLLKDDTNNYLVVDKPRGGGKPKRPKTAAKPKRPKTAAKRPKTSK